MGQYFWWSFSINHLNSWNGLKSFLHSAGKWSLIHYLHLIKKDIKSQDVRRKTKNTEMLPLCERKKKMQLLNSSWTAIFDTIWYYTLSLGFFQPIYIRRQKSMPVFTQISSCPFPQLRSEKELLLRTTETIALCLLVGFVWLVLQLCCGQKPWISVIKINYFGAFSKLLRKELNGK